MLWWHWIIAALILAFYEFVTPGGFIAIFFSIAALLVGGLVAAVAAPPWAQGLLFAGLSVASLLLFRRRLLQSFSPEHRGEDMGDLVGGTAIAGEDMAPNAFGRGEFRGTQWALRNVGDGPIAKGQRCRIDGVDGLMLLVKAE